MTTVCPKLLHKNGRDVPVWEIRTGVGRAIYYERVNRQGLIPIGGHESFALGTATVRVFELVNTRNMGSPTILTESEGYVAPDSWYERDPNYTGPVVTRAPVPVQDDVDSDIEDTWANDASVAVGGW